MREFVMRSSLIRRTVFLASFVPLIFLADFASTFWTNRRLDRGLGEMNRLDTDELAVAHTLVGLDAALGALRSFEDKPDPAKRLAFRENLKQAEESLSQLDSLPIGPALRPDLDSLAASADRMFRAPSRFFMKAELLVSSQFGLEMGDALRKAQVELKARHQRAFDRIYRTRWLPLIVSTALDLVFIALLFFLIVPPLRALIRSVRNLAAAADRIMSGDSGYQAPILTEDELGKVTDAFNRVVASLNLKEQEMQARVAAEISRLEFISRTAESLAQSIEFDQIPKRIAEAAIPFLGDRCAVDLVDSDGRVRRAAAAASDPNEVARLGGSASEDSEREGSEHEGSPHDAASPLSTEVARGGRAVVSPPELPDLWTKEPANADPLLAAPSRSALSVPIHVRGNVAGVLTIASDHEAGWYGRKEQLVAEDLARRAGYAFENARLLREAKAAIQTRDDFLSIASHELRTPLTPLRMQIQMLGRALEKGNLDPDRVRNAIATSDRMVTRLNLLVDDLLEVSRINSGRLELRYDECDLAEIIREVLTRFQWEIERVGSRVEVEAPDSLRVRADPGKIEQVFVNLVTNALKYGKGKPISVSLVERGGSAVFRIADQGIGIAPADLDRIFGRFERASNTTTISGLGLGLFITSQIVELHGGKITVESTLGSGSRFTVTLPREPRTPAPAAPK